MFPYRELAEGRKFRCAECGRVKRVKYVPVSDLCRRCAARKAAETRRSASNIPISLAENLVVTRAVERKLRRKAESHIPYGKAEKIGSQIGGWLVVIFVVSGFFIARTFYQGHPGLSVIFFFAWAIGGPSISMEVIDRFLAKPRREREERIAARLADLATERKRMIEEAMRFYSSPEWSLLRKQAIERDGRICSHCGKRIKDDFDLTVDHKLPRSKHPDLALKIENLRVFCRACNSKKGARDWSSYVKDEADGGRT
jgi:5-methylcytosine-specific restriction endonuclease McrA